MQWALPLWSLAVAVPVVILLSVRDTNIPQVLKLTAALAVVLALSAFYVGWQAGPEASIQYGSITVAFMLSTGIAVFKVLMYLQQRADGARPEYSVLFTYSWRNFLTAALSALFVGGVCLVLVLWAALFNVIRAVALKSSQSESSNWLTTVPRIHPQKA